MKKYIIPSLIIILIIALMIVGTLLLTKSSPYTKEELAFLEKEGFLDENGLVAKSSTLIEQNINKEDEGFEVLATKLDNTSYQLAFRLENKSDEKREFYLIPITKDNQAEFQEIKGVINNKNLLSINKDDVKKEPLETLYNIQQHKKELTPELAQAYDDIDNNGYQAKPIRITLDANTTLLAKSRWDIAEGEGILLQPVYFLVYGSAGGAKDELTILTVHSSPQQGENWEVKFITKGVNDLRIIPNDQSTINDDEFIGLYCGNEKKTPQILPGDVIYYPNWYCGEKSRVIHYTKKEGRHTLRFEFGNEVEYAYNAVHGEYTKLLIIKEETYKKNVNEIGDIIGFFPDSHKFSPDEVRLFEIIRVEGTRKEVMDKFKGVKPVKGEEDKYQFNKSMLEDEKYN